MQTAYGAEDIGKLRNLVTPEMLSYFLEDFNANASRGVVNRISDMKLLQGDAAEAWREGDTEYCTVAVRYSLKDEIVDRASGRVVERGDDEATEIWTFMRARGGSWIVSASQQTELTRAATFKTATMRGWPGSEKSRPLRAAGPKAEQTQARHLLVERQHGVFETSHRIRGTWSCRSADPDRSATRPYRTSV